MSDEEARAEIRAAIDWYDERGRCWLSAVTFIGICWAFGSWSEFVASVRRPWGRQRKEETTV